MSTQPSSQTASIRKVRDFEDLYDTSNVSAPSGITYSNQLNRFLTFPATSSSATSSEITAIATTDVLDSGKSQRLGIGITDPLNTAYDNRFNRLLTFQNNQIVEVGSNSDGTLANDKITRVILPTQSDAVQLDAQLSTTETTTETTTGTSTVSRRNTFLNPQGITIDTKSGAIYVLNSGIRGTEIVQIQPGADGNLQTAAVSRIGLSLPTKSVRGIAIDPTTGRFQVLSPTEQKLYELSAKGEIVATRDVSGLGLRNPQSITFAPSGDQTDDPNRQSIYISDSTAGGVGVVEISLVTPQNIQATNTATLIRTVNTSQFSPASPMR